MGLLRTLGPPSFSLAGIGLVCALLAGGCSFGSEDPGRTDVAEDRTTGWQKLPVPPEVRDRQALVATDAGVLAFGGCAPEPSDECRPTREGFAFEPSAGAWSEIPSAPFAVTGASLWTGEKAVFLDTGGQGALRALAYSPDSEAWRSLPPAPLRAKGSDAIWTGSEVIVWGGGGRAGPAAEAGAAYEPASDAWRKIADAPLSLNSVSLIWSGSEVIALGSRLDLRNRSSSRYAEGAAYDPVIDTWRRLEDSGLSPQAHAAEWVGRQMVAYDYVTRFQRYDPERNRWSSKRRMPLEAGECYPDSVTVGGLMLAFYCGQVALFDPASDNWRAIEGGLSERVNRSNAYGRPLRVWRFASLTATGDTVYFLAEGITFSGRVEAQYGFPGSPVSFWSYRPPSEPR